MQAEGPTFWPIKILGQRQTQKGEEWVQQILIEWQEGGQDGETWEDKIFIGEQYPDFNLGDKADLQVEGNDTTWRVFKRRKRND